MPTPVLEIPINDTDFKAFVEAFQKYQAEVKEQPAAWQGVNQSIDNMNQSMGKVSIVMEEQLKLLDKITEREDARDRKAVEANERKKRAAEEAARQEEAEANRRRSAVEQVREYSRNVGKVVDKAGKWAGDAATGAIGSMTGGAAGLFSGVGKMLSGIPLVGGMLGGLALGGFEALSSLSNTGRAAHGLGVNTQTLQAWQTTVGMKLPQGSIDSLLNTVSEAKASPGGGGMFGRFGIKDYGHKDVSGLTAEMLMTAQKFLHQHPGDQGMWKAKTLYGGALDTGTLRTLQGMTEGELKKSIGDMTKFVQNNSEAEDAAKKATDELAKSEQTATSLLDKFGSGLTQALDQVTEALKGLFDIIQPFLNVKKDWQKFKAAVDLSGGGLKTGDGKSVSVGGALGIIGHDIWNAPGNLIGAVGSAIADGLNFGGTSKADRNNNPGNIMHGNQYVRYASKEAGFTAMANQLQIDYNKHGAHSISALINGPDHPWASENAPGNTHAGTMNYIDKVSKALGVKSGDNINLNDPGTLARVAKAMYEFESGHVAKAVAQAVKHGTVAAHKVIGAKAHVTVKTQQKPGSDVTVSARQLAGR